MSDKWRKNKTAALEEGFDSGFETVPRYDEFEEPIPVATPLYVEGMLIGGSYGREEEVAEWIAPELYGVEYAVGSPEQPEHYDISSQRVEMTTRERDREYMGTGNTASLLKHPTARGGGGSNSKGGIRVEKPGYKLRKERSADQSVESTVTRFCVSGLTVGEAEFYHQRPGTARIILTNYVKNLVAAYAVQIQGGSEFSVIPIPVVPKNRPLVEIKPSFEIYGLLEPVIEMLRKHAGAARAELIRYAYQHGGERIQLRDAA